MFPLLGVQPRLGRNFTEAEDQPDGPRVAILSNGLWQRRFGGDSGIIGKDILLDDKKYTVVGVMPAGFQLLWSVDRDQPIANIRTVEDILGEDLMQRRVGMTLLGAFAGLALLLASLGIYGILYYSVSQRTHEIGLRMALGARPLDILRMVGGAGIALTGIGIAIGLPAAFALSRVISSLLFKVSATDPLVFVSVPSILIGVALIASYLPARRATRVDPMVTLRHD
jgi:ABC-type antimicrobial peptide transport system permease subunit